MNKKELIKLIEDYDQGITVELSVKGEEYDICQIDFVVSNFFINKDDKKQIPALRLVANPT